VKPAIATGAALGERGLRNDESAPEPGAETEAFLGDLQTLGEVLAMNPDEFRRWATFVQARRTVGDD
jgi:hypothetical protein